MKLRMMSNIGFGLIVLTLLTTALLGYLDGNKFIDNNASVLHTYKVITTIDQFFSLAQDAETGQRGYIITGEERYLAPYQDATTRIVDTLNQIQELTVDNPAQQRNVDDLKLAMRAKLSELDETIRLRKESGFDAALQVVSSDKGKRFMDDIRSLVVRMTGAETSLLGSRQEKMSESIGETRSVMVLGAFAAIIVTIIVAIVFHRMTGKLQDLLAAVSTTANSLAAASSELLAGTTQQSASAQEQAAAVTETIATVEEVDQTSKQAAQRATAVANSAQRAAEISKTGRQAVDESVASMAIVKDQTGAIAENILALAERAQAIGEIIATVNDVAEQTNMLALNAGIEAARAGEHGAGFTVVAREIKDLADQAKRATAQVRLILSEIQKATNSAVMVTEEGSKSVNATIKAVNSAGETIRMLATTIDEAATAASQIAASAVQQATGMGQIQQAMRDISGATNQNLASTKQAERAAQDLNALGGRLRELLAG